MIDIGRIAYSKYIESINGINLSPWEKIGKIQQDAWRAAAVAVCQYLNEQEELMKTNPEIEG